MTSIDLLLAALKTAGLDTAANGGEVMVKVPGMRKPREAHLDLSDLSLPSDDVACRIACVSFARGVYACCAEPADSRAKDESFELAASSMMPSLEGPWFGRGYEAAAGEPAWLRPFSNGISIVVMCELDDGIRALTESQLKTWGVTADRVHKASLSILFHRTTFAATGDVDVKGIQRFGMRDGYDAGRALMLDLWDYPLTRSGVLFSVPSSECILLAKDTSAEGQAALREATVTELNRADAPLSADVFAFFDGHRQTEPLL
ncbi:MAG: hypothetical protein ACI81R_001064 [Bradymonadia bacterium]|jgi:hypothetical protein